MVAALAVGAAITERLPQSSDVTAAPFVIQADVGQAVKMRTGTVTVTSVEAAATVADSATKATSKNGLFLVIHLTWVPSGEPSSLSGMWVEGTDGRTFGGQQAVTSTCTSAQTGIGIACQEVFEMPKGALPGATLVVPATSLGTEGDQEVHVDLGITEQQRDAWAGRTDVVPLPEPSQGTVR